MAESAEDVNTLKRRGRRRLVGAIALVLAAVIVLPMVFDSAPKPGGPPVSVRIPGEEEVGFTPKVTPKTPAPDAKAQVRAAEKQAEKAAEKAPEKAVEKAPEPEPAPKIEITVKKGTDKAAVAADAERKRAETALTGGEQFVVPAGAYADPAGVIETLKAAKIPYYTEPIATKQGTVTRVRAGPFAGRDAAERALKQLRNLGLKPGEIATKS
ncbi:MAG: SPOR domain-containing protein [Burkholderiales bacterium]